MYLPVEWYTRGAVRKAILWYAPIKNCAVFATKPGLITVMLDAQEGNVRPEDFAAIAYGLRQSLPPEVAFRLVDWALPGQYG